MHGQTGAAGPLMGARAARLAGGGRGAWWGVAQPREGASPARGDHPGGHAGPAAGPPGEHCLLQVPRAALGRAGRGGPPPGPRLPAQDWCECCIHPCCCLLGLGTPCACAWCASQAAVSEVWVHLEGAAGVQGMLHGVACCLCRCWCAGGCTSSFVLGHGTPMVAGPLKWSSLLSYVACAWLCWGYVHGCLRRMLSCCIRQYPTSLGPEKRCSGRQTPPDGVLPLFPIGLAKTEAEKPQCLLITAAGQHTQILSFMCMAHAWMDDSYTHPCMILSALWKVLLHMLAMQSCCSVGGWGGA